MQLLDSALSRFTLQRRVAFITGTGTLLVASVNLSGYSLLRNANILESLGEAYVLPIFVLSGLFYLSGVADRDILRYFQVSVFAIGGLYLALVASGEYMSSAVFVIFAFVLYYEFRTERLSSAWLTVIGVAYGAGIVYSIVRSAETAASSMAVSAFLVGLAFTNLAIFTGSVVFLFALVLYRQHLIRKRYSDELETRVLERTQELREAVSQRDIMLQEIHHRVGNSLQLLASFISLQQDDADSAQRRILKETELRVHAIADVHATLYSHHQLSHLPLDDYTRDLIADMQIAYRGDAHIVADIEADTEAHIDFAISFGIILNELITNAAKHGSRATGLAHVEVELRDHDTSLRLVVRDGGPGFAEDFVPGVGTEVVDQLVSQNGGDIVRKTNDGAIVVVVFPKSCVVRDEPIRVTQESRA